MMKKWILGLLILTIWMITGCQAETDLETYLLAVEKTEYAVQGKSESRMIIENEFDIEGIDDQTRKSLAAFERMEWNTYLRFDETRLQNDFYMNFGGIGFDASYYKDGDLEFMKLPLVNKYMKLDASGMESAWDPELLAIFEPVGEEWMRMLTEENVFQGKRHVLTTEDGDVKVTRFTIELTEGQISQMVEVAARVLEENEKQILESGILGQETDEEGHELLTAFAKQVRFAQFDEFVYTADIDIDGYLIQDSFYGAIHYGEGHGMTTSVDVKTLYWGFHENPDFTIPTPTETEWVDETDPEMETSFLMEFMGGIRNESN